MEDIAQRTKGRRVGFVEGEIKIIWCGVPNNRAPSHRVIMIEKGDRIIGKVNNVHYAL